MKNSFLFLFIAICSSLSFANLVVDEKGCTTKMIQVMKPEYPRANYQGYAIIQFDINKDGSVSNNKVSQSMCALSRDIDGNILFKKCPYFKPQAVSASKYLKFKPPLNDNKSCSIKNHFHKYTFKIYPANNDDFVLRREYQNLKATNKFNSNINLNENYIDNSVTQPLLKNHADTRTTNPN